jgi:hypothetical protein
LWHGIVWNFEWEDSKKKHFHVNKGKKKTIFIIMSSFILQVKRYDTYTCKKVEKKPNSFEVFMKKILEEFIFRQ